MLKLTLVGACLLPGVMSAQDVDRTKYPDFSATVNPDWSLMKPMRKAGAKAETKRPDHYNNADTPYFPPVFNQAGGSCGSASRICYMFTHELNSFRGTNGKDPHHYYPSHFVWLLTNGKLRQGCLRAVRRCALCCHLWRTDLFQPLRLSGHFRQRLRMDDRLRQVVRSHVQPYAQALQLPHQCGNGRRPRSCEELALEP